MIEVHYTLLRFKNLNNSFDTLEIVINYHSIFLDYYIQNYTKKLWLFRYNTIFSDWKQIIYYGLEY